MIYQKMDYQKLIYLLDLVIENYIDKWEPIGSKFLHWLEETEYAPSTLRKYLNHLEKEWFLYQPYNSAWRVPTVKWMSQYVEDILQDDKADILDKVDFDYKYARNWLKFIVESLSNYVDWTVVWFLKNDEYFFLWINKLFKDEYMEDYSTIKNIVKFIEDKRLIEFLDKKVIKRNNISYDFIEYNQNLISAIYSKIDINWFDWIISIIWPVRTNYKDNVSILKQFLQTYNSNQF